MGGIDDFDVGVVILEAVEGEGVVDDDGVALDRRGACANGDVGDHRHGFGRHGWSNVGSGCGGGGEGEGGGKEGATGERQVASNLWGGCRGGRRGRTVRGNSSDRENEGHC